MQVFLNHETLKEMTVREFYDSLTPSNPGLTQQDCKPLLKNTEIAYKHHKVNFVFINKDIMNSIIFDKVEEYRQKDAITFCVTTNFTGEPYLPLTKWMLAHRIHHALINSNFYLLFREIFKVSGVEGPRVNLHHLHPIANGLLTCNSARKNILNPVDSYPELIAQYLVTGRITLNKDFNPLETLENQTKRSTVYLHNLMEPPAPTKKLVQLYTSLIKPVQDNIDLITDAITRDCENTLEASLGKIAIL